MAGLSRRTAAAALNRAGFSCDKPAAPLATSSWATRPVSTLRAGADASDGGDAADSEAVAAENKAIEEGAAAAKAVMDATDEFRAKQVNFFFIDGWMHGWTDIDRFIFFFFALGAIAFAIHTSDYMQLNGQSLTIGKWMTEWRLAFAWCVHHEERLDFFRFCLFWCRGWIQADTNNEAQGKAGR
ncbi:unnamed protein product [Pylaiella littoralis]